MISTYTRLSPILILLGFMIFHQIFSRGTKPSLSSPSICRTPSLQSATRKPFQHLAGRKTFPRIYRTYSMVDHTEYSPETLSGEEKGFAEHIPVSRHVIESLEERGIRFPTPIQAASMERIYEGENAILHAETGSGKSLAFLLPALARLEEDDTLLLLAPTRELAVQLASEASLLVESPESVQVIVPGATPLHRALKNAKVIVGTPEEIDNWKGRKNGEPVEIRDLEFVRKLRMIVMDEIDFLLPTVKFYGPRAKAKKVKFNRWSKEKTAPAESLLSKKVFPSNTRRDLQVISASATVGRETKMKVARVLRKDPFGRFQKTSEDKSKELSIIRPGHVDGKDLSAEPRAVTVPGRIQHAILPLHGSVSKSAIPALASSLRESQPKSALVFICPSSGLSAAKVVKKLQDEGIDAEALHEALGWTKGLKLDHASGISGHDASSSLREKHHELSSQFTHAGEYKTPVVVTFEAMARGLHFDAVDVVYIIGRPASHKMYLHLAGRTGRYPVLEGRVVTICSHGDGDHLRSWKRQLGGIDFEILSSTTSNSKSSLESSERHTTSASSTRMIEGEVDDTEIAL